MLAIEIVDRLIELCVDKRIGDVVGGKQIAIDTRTELANLIDDDQASVRTLQRNYIAVWVGLLGRIQPDVEPAVLRLKVQAAFGLINSTPHSARSQGRNVDPKTARPVLEALARAGAVPSPPAGLRP